MKRSIIIFGMVLLIFVFASFLQRSVEGQAGYAGVDTCKGCHEDKFDSISRQAHGKKAVAGSPANVNACETCHGPGAAHAEKGGGKGVGGIKNFGKQMTASEKSAVCLGCHENSKLLIYWDTTKHKKNDVACTDCHSIHKKAPDGIQYTTCVSCHRDIKAQINKRSHHPIVEGKVKCYNCHNPHGSTGPSMIKADSVNELCYSCHSEKRGPYVWEHPPVEENCINCHTPHGSTHGKLMTEKIPNLCQACHDWQRHPGTRYGSETGLTGSSPSNRFFARSCINCHNAIHGSNAPANPASGYNSGKFFVR